MAKRAPGWCAGAVVLAVAAAVLILVIRQGGTDPAPGGAVVARVNGRPVPCAVLLATLGEYVDLERLTPAQRDPARGAALVKDLVATYGAWQVERAFERCVYAALADAAIARAGVTVDPGAVQARFAAESARWTAENGHDVAYDDYLRRTGRTPDARKRELGRDLGLDAVLGPPTATALKEHFERLRPHFEGRQVRLRHILVADEAKATSVKEALLKGGDFAKLAQKHSRERATAKRGGEVAWIERRGDVPEPLAAAAFDLKLGAVGGPVRTVYGWHVLRVDEVRPGTPLNYDEAAGRVAPDLNKRRRIAFMAAERKKAQVDRLW